MRVLVTGGYGFIGSYVSERFYSEGYQVYIIDNLSTGKKEYVSIPHKFYQLDIENSKCEEVFRSGKFDVVVHLAAQIDVETSVKQPSLDTKANILGLVNMLSYAKKYGVKKFIFASSAAVYGSTYHLPLAEEDPCAPMSPYGINKYLGEYYCKQWQDLYGLNTLCFRFSNVYGPRQGNVGEGGVISKFMQRMCNGKPLHVFGDGEQTRDFIYVEDVAEAIYRSSSTDLMGVYNLSTNTEISINQLIEVLDQMAPIHSIEYVKKRESDIERSSLNNTRLKSSLDWVPLFSIEEGLMKTYRWFRQHNVEPRRTEEKSRHKHPLFREILPYIENILAFSIVLLITLSKIQLLQNLVMDYNIVYIVLIGVVYGTRQSLISVLLSICLVVSTKVFYGREIVSLFYDSQFLFTIASYLFVGLVIGFTTDKRKQEQDSIKSELLAEQENYEFLLNVYHDTCEVKNELQKQIIRNRDGIGRVYSVIRELDSDEPEEVLLNSVNVLENLIGSGHISIYVSNYDDDFRLLVESRGDKVNPLRTLKLVDHPKLLQMVEKKDIYFNRKFHPGYPSMVAPIMYQSKVVALVTIDELPFEYFTHFYENLIKISVDMFSRALSKAFAFAAMSSELRYVTGTSILSEKIMAKIMECKWKAKLRHQINYEILKIENNYRINNELAQIITRLIGNTNYLGMLNGDLVVLLSNPSSTEMEMMINELEKLGLYIAPLGEVRADEKVGKLTYA